jgi:outer membrane murein-binding lipoprotein Lpp
MKRFLGFICASVVLSFALAGCGPNQNAPKTSAQTQQTVATQESAVSEVKSVSGDVSYAYAPPAKGQSGSFAPPSYRVNHASESGSADSSSGARSSQDQPLAGEIYIHITEYPHAGNTVAENTPTTSNRYPLFHGLSDGQNNVNVPIFHGLSDPESGVPLFHGLR